MTQKIKHLTSLMELNNAMLLDLIKHATKIKKNPEKYHNKLKNKTMLMIFEKPSLRTRISFEVGMLQLGGHAININTKDTPLFQKESVSDTAKTISRYCDIIMARLFNQKDIEALAQNSSIPVINGLTDTFHPCQILSDILTIYEKKNKLKGLKLCYLGDGNNNITHDLLLGCSAIGIDISVACPKNHAPQEWIINEAQKKSKITSSKIEITQNPKIAAQDADIIYTDTWMSYHIPKEQEQERIKLFMPYQVNNKLMLYAKKDAVFMHCLPAMRRFEQTSEVIDGKQSIVFDQAENRLHMQKAIILKLLNNNPKN